MITNLRIFHTVVNSDNSAQGNTSIVFWWQMLPKLKTTLMMSFVYHTFIKITISCKD